MTEAMFEPKHTIECSLVSPENVNYCWEGCEKYLKRSIKRSNGRDQIENIYHQIMSGQLNLWIAFDEDMGIHGCAVTQINTYDTGLNLLMIVHLGGEKMDEWVHGGLDTLEKFAAAAGCQGVEAFGRPGFWHWIKDEDWEKQAVVYQKRFN